MKIYPLKFEAIFKERIWGGQALREVFGKDLPAGKSIGESWELADLPDDKSVIVNGPLAGKNIAEAIAECGAAITGKDDYTPPLPLLIKILDAQTKLSVQVHPDEATCARTGKGDPKTECWYIIEANEGAAIYKGLKAGTTRQKFAAAIENGTCAELLERIEVTPGECHFLPSGTAHAIGEGLLIAEIQQPSDTTYRVFDWNRVGDDGKPRQLHVADALESIHFDPSGDDLSIRSDGRLVDADEFKVDKATGQAGSESMLTSGEMKVFMIISGTGTITCEDVEDVDFAKGDTLLIPAQFEGAMAFAADTVYLIAAV
ncbi:MAG TPA: mannose-6-phosphate isomerase [Phycisphaerales bacterium]|nr:mannose-6-phosphate isomerase [Phycisphaerales bacterium]